MKKKCRPLYVACKQKTPFDIFLYHLNTLKLREIIRKLEYLECFGAFRVDEKNVGLYMLFVAKNVFLHFFQLLQTTNTLTLEYLECLEW